MDESSINRRNILLVLGAPLGDIMVSASTVGLELAIYLARLDIANIFCIVQSGAERHPVQGITMYECPNDEIDESVATLQEYIHDVDTLIGFLPEARGVVDTICDAMDVNRTIIVHCDAIQEQAEYHDAVRWFLGPHIGRIADSNGNNILIPPLCNYVQVNITERVDRDFHFIFPLVLHQTSRQYLLRHGFDVGFSAIRQFAERYQIEPVIIVLLSNTLMEYNIKRFAQEYGLRQGLRMGTPGDTQEWTQYIQHASLALCTSRESPFDHWVFKLIERNVPFLVDASSGMGQLLSESHPFAVVQTVDANTTPADHWSNAIENTLDNLDNARVDFCHGQGTFNRAHREGFVPLVEQIFTLYELQIRPIDNEQEIYDITEEINQKFRDLTDLIIGNNLLEISKNSIKLKCESHEPYTRDDMEVGKQMIKLYREFKKLGLAIVRVHQGSLVLRVLSQSTQADKRIEDMYDDGSLFKLVQRCCFGETDEAAFLLDFEKINPQGSRVVPKTTATSISRNLKGGASGRSFTRSLKTSVYPQSMTEKRDSIQKTGFGQFYDYLEEMDAANEPLREEYVNDMKVIQIPMNQAFADKKRNLRKYIIGTPRKKHEQKTIMVVGATGSGKSTLVDGLVNYVFGTKWTDTQRIRLIDQLSEEADDASSNQGHSQTEWITIYTLTCGNSHNIPFTLNIIDTPGFGDTRGKSRDQRLVEQIRGLFSCKDNHGLDSIDAICFVAKAPDARLTASQNYIFNSVLSVFGTNIAENILVMIPFADAEKPAVLDAIKAADLPHRQYFSFNNSALFADNSASGSLSKYFWDMNFDSFKHFFDFLGTITPKSITITQDVLEKRRRLKDTLNYLQNKIQEGLDIMITLGKDKEIFEKHKQDIDSNSDFKMETDEIYQDKLYLGYGKYSNYCDNCANTCHYECKASKLIPKYFCEVFNVDGCCTRCRNKCPVGKHKMVNFRYVSKSRKASTTYRERLKTYQLMTGNRDDSLSIIEQNEMAYGRYKNEFRENMDSFADVIKNLNEIALKPDPVSEVDYVGELIATEKSEHKDGWKERVQELRNFKKQTAKLKEMLTNPHNLTIVAI